MAGRENAESEQSVPKGTDMNLTQESYNALGADAASNLVRYISTGVEP